MTKIKLTTEIDLDEEGFADEIIDIMVDLSEYNNINDILESLNDAELESFIKEAIKTTFNMNRDCGYYQDDYIWGLFFDFDDDTFKEEREKECDRLYHMVLETLENHRKKCL